MPSWRRAPPLKAVLSNYWKQLKVWIHWILKKKKPMKWHFYEKYMRMPLVIVNQCGYVSLLAINLYQLLIKSCDAVCLRPLRTGCWNVFFKGTDYRFHFKSFFTYDWHGKNESAFKIKIKLILKMSYFPQLSPPEVMVRVFTMFLSLASLTP